MYEMMPDKEEIAFILAVEALPDSMIKGRISLRAVHSGAGPREQARSCLREDICDDRRNQRDEKARIADYLINPVDSRTAAMEKPQTLKQVYSEAEPVAGIDGFLQADREACSVS
jgi:hypothetical protein